MTRKIADKATKPEPLSRTEKKAAKVDAWVKGHLTEERASQAIKRKELKALRTSGKDKS